MMRTQLKALAYYQILLGVYALILLVLSSFKGVGLFEIPVILLTLALILFIIYSGAKILSDPLKGVKLSLFAQLIQIFAFTVPPFYYALSTFGIVSLSITEMGFGLHFNNAISVINIGYNRLLEHLELRVFLAPLIVFILLSMLGFNLEKLDKSEYNNSNKTSRGIR